MKTLKIVLIVIAVLVAIPLIIALFVKKDYTIEREVIINKSQPEVFNYAKLIKNQESYNKWMMADPASHTYTGIDGTVGAKVAWNSKDNNVGEGFQEIVSVSDKDLEIHITFIRPFKGAATTSVFTEAIDENQTKVKTVFSSAMTYPMNFMLLFIDMEKMLGADLESNHTRMKAILEQ